MPHTRTLAVTDEALRIREIPENEKNRYYTHI